MAIRHSDREVVSEIQNGSDVVNVSPESSEWSAMFQMTFVPSVT